MSSDDEAGNIPGNELESSSSLVTHLTNPEDGTTVSGETPRIRMREPDRSTNSSEPAGLRFPDLNADDHPIMLHPGQVGAQHSPNNTPEPSLDNLSGAGRENQQLSGDVASADNNSDVLHSVNVPGLSLGSSLNVSNTERSLSVGISQISGAGNSASQTGSDGVEVTTDQECISVFDKPGSLLGPAVVPIDTVREGVEKLSLNENPSTRISGGPNSDPKILSDERNVPFLDQLVSSSVTQEGASQSDGTVEMMHTSGDSTPVEEEIIEHKELVLREFQKEIADKKATKGANDIILLPTGTGKTYVAIEVIRRHLEKNPYGKIVFFVPTKELTTQQLKKIQTYIQPEFQRKCESITGSDDLSNKQLIEKIKTGTSQVFVVTPAMIVNYLKKSGGITQTSVSDFSLFIFDECHHAKKNHMYARILKEVLLADKEKQRVPQLLGMTATIGSVEKKDIDDAKEVIAKICALFMMNEEPSKVEISEASLKEATNNPNELRIDVEDERRDELSTFIREKLVQKITNEIDRRGPNLKLKKDYEISFPNQTGTQQFDHYVSTLMGKVQESSGEDTDSKYVIRACMFLKVYHRALSIINLLNGEYGLSYLQETIGEDPRYHAIQSLYYSYSKNYQHMKSLAEKDVDNEKLRELKSFLDTILKEDKSQIMIFIKERKVCHFLFRYLKDHLYKVRPYTSTSAKANGGGMNRSQQAESRQMFEEGKANILVSTSIAEEGTDIQAVNATVRYMYVKDPTAAQQIKGRSRKKGGQDVLIANTKLNRQDQRNTERNTVMKEALKSIREHPEQFKKLIDKETKSILEKISDGPTPAKKHRNNKKGPGQFDRVYGQYPVRTSEPKPPRKPEALQPEKTEELGKTEKSSPAGEPRKRARTSVDRPVDASNMKQLDAGPSILPQALEELSLDDVEMSEDLVEEEAEVEKDQPGVPTGTGPIRCAACKTHLGDVADVKCFMETHYLIMDKDLPMKVRIYPLEFDLKIMQHEVKATNLLICMGRIMGENEEEESRQCQYPVGTLIKIKDRYKLGLWKPSNILIGEPGKIAKFKQWATIKKKYKVETVEPEHVLELADENQFVPEKAMEQMM